MAASINHLVGAGEQRRGHVDAERLGGPQIDRQEHLGRELHRQVTRRSSAQDFVYKVGAAIKAPAQIDPIADQSASQDVLAISVTVGSRFANAAVAMF